MRIPRGHTLNLVFARVGGMLGALAVASSAVELRRAVGCTRQPPPCRELRAVTSAAAATGRAASCARRPPPCRRGTRGPAPRTAGCERGSSAPAAVIRAGDLRRSALATGSHVGELRPEQVSASPWDCLTEMRYFV